jgi:hypothetical protein
MLPLSRYLSRVKDPISDLAGESRKGDVSAVVFRAMPDSESLLSRHRVAREHGPRQAVAVVVSATGTLLADTSGRSRNSRSTRQLGMSRPGASTSDLALRWLIRVA